MSLAPFGRNRFLNACDLVSTEVVHHHNISRFQNRDLSGVAPN